MNRSPSTDDFESSPGNSLGLGDIVNSVWNLRLRIALVALVGAVVAGFLLIAAIGFMPAKQQSQLKFRLLFQGADKGLYPNGAKFVPSDLVSTPVLQEVYRRNRLETFIPFEDFKNALVVTNSNAATDRLQREYENRIKDRRLLPVDRMKLESEFAARALAAQDGEYTLLLEVEGAFTRWSGNLAGKVLGDVLYVWAEQSRNRGVFRFDFNILSDNILNEISADVSDYPILLDRIRITMDRVSTNLEQLSKTPGARLVRAGDKKISLEEVEVLLRDDLRYRLRMIEIPVYALGLERERIMSDAYVTEQLFRIQRETENFETRKGNVQQALLKYSESRAAGQGDVADGTGSTRPAAGSFLDQVLDLSVQGGDIAFRQSLVKEQLALSEQIIALDHEREIYGKMKNRAINREIALQVQREDLEPWVQDQIKGIVSRLGVAIGYAKALHEEISQRNLQPSMIYVAIDPLEQDTVAKIGGMKLLVVFGFLWAVYVAGVTVIMAWSRLWK